MPDFSQHTAPDSKHPMFAVVSADSNGNLKVHKIKAFDGLAAVKRYRELADLNEETVLAVARWTDIRLIKAIPPPASDWSYYHYPRT
jgi:hypothetical protein